jgi:hypothetical protein
MKSLIKIAFVILLYHMIGCKKNNEEAKQFRPSFQGTINNVQFSYEQSDIYRLAGGASFMERINGTDTAGLAIESGLFKVRYLPDTIIQNSIYVFFTEHIPEDSLNSPPSMIPVPERIFRKMFSIGDYKYTYIPSVKGGIIVTWYDSEGNKWASGKDNSWDTIPPAQPDYSQNNFSIVYSNPVTVQPNTYNYQQEVHIVFNSWVYNKKGDSLRIENAQLNTIYSY